MEIGKKQKVTFGLADGQTYQFKLSHEDIEFVKTNILENRPLLRMFDPINTTIPIVYVLIPVKHIISIEVS